MNNDLQTQRLFLDSAGGGVAVGQLDHETPGVHYVYIAFYVPYKEQWDDERSNLAECINKRGSKDDAGLD